MPRGVYPRTWEHSQRIREGIAKSAAWRAARKSPVVRAKQSAAKKRWWKAQKGELVKKDLSYISSSKNESSSGVSHGQSS